MTVWDFCYEHPFITLFIVLIFCHMVEFCFEKLLEK